MYNYKTMRHEPIDPYVCDDCGRDVDELNDRGQCAACDRIYCIEQGEAMAESMAELIRECQMERLEVRV